MNSITGWSAGVLDTVNYRSGGAGVKLSPTVSATVTSTKNLGTALNLGGFSNADEVRFWVYVDVIANLNQIQVSLIDNQGSPVTGTLTRTAGQLVQGWNRVSLPKSSFTNYLTLRWSNIVTIVLVATASASGTCNVTFDMLRMMIGPTIGYTAGMWDETHALADVVDGRITFFDTGYWQFTNASILSSTMYRLDNLSKSVVTTTTGYAQVSGNNTSLQSLELFVPGFDMVASLKKWQPSYYSNSTIMNAIRSAQGLLLNSVMGTVVDLFNQTFSTKASYWLSKYEQLVGQGDQSFAGFSLLQRRNKLSTRYKFAFLTANVPNVVALVQNFVQSATVTQNAATYSMVVNIVNPKGTPSNLSDIQDAIERFKPAHISYTITYTFTVWNTMDGYSRPWNTADTYKWDGFEVS